MNTMPTHTIPRIPPFPTPTNSSTPRPAMNINITITALHLEAEIARGQAIYLTKESFSSRGRAQRSLIALANAWMVLHTNLTKTADNITNANGTLSYRSVIAHTPSLILRAMYSTTYAHLGVSEQHPSVPDLRRVNHHSELHLQGSTHYLSPLLPLTHLDLRDSVPDRALVARFRSMGVVGLMAVLSTEAAWEWEAFLEMHGRRVRDWREFGVLGDFEAGGREQGAVRSAEEGLSGYERFWSLETVLVVGEGGREGVGVGVSGHGEGASELGNEYEYGEEGEGDETDDNGNEEAEWDEEEDVDGDADVVMY